jgi:hypothetical protein
MKDDNHIPKIFMDNGTQFPSELGEPLKGAGTGMGSYLHF